MSGKYFAEVKPALLQWDREVRADRLGVAVVGGAVAGLLVLAAGVVADAVWGLPVEVRVGLWVVAAGAWAARVTPVVWERRRGARVVEIAAAAEERTGLPKELLVTVASHFESPTAGVSGEMAERLAGVAAKRVGEGGGLRHVGRAKGSLVRGLLVVVVLAAGAAFWPGAMGAAKRVLVPWGESGAGAGGLMVAPAGAEVEQGGSVRVVATLDVALSGADALPVLETSTDGVEWTGTVMSPRGAAGYIAAMENLQRDVRFRVRAGGAVSEVQTVRVMTQPALRQLRAEVTYPESLGGEKVVVSPVAVGAGGETKEIRVPTGSAVVLELAATEALASAVVYAPGLELTAVLKPGDGSMATVRLPGEITATPGSSAELRVRVTGTRGGVAWSSVMMATLPDDDPTVRILSPLAGSPLGPRDDLEVSVLAEDDRALASGELRLVTARGPTTMPLQLKGTPRRWQGRTRVSLAGLNLVPGEGLSLSAMVRDSAGRTAVSGVVGLEVSATAPDPLTAARVSALAEAGALAGQAEEELVRAAERLQRAAQNATDEGETASARLAVAGATEAVSRLQRSLARVIRVSPDGVVGDAVANVADATVGVAVMADEALVLSATNSGEVLSGLAKKMRSAAEGLKTGVNEPLADLRRGDTASLLIGSREAARSLVSGVDSDLSSADDGELERVSRLAAARLQSLGAPDLTVVGKEGGAGLLPARLELAWRMEAFRSDSIAQRAADLSLAARAARKLGTVPAADSNFMLSFAALEADHLAGRLRRSAPAGELAVSARAALRALAGEATIGGAEVRGPMAAILERPAGDDPEVRRATRLGELAVAPRDLAKTLRTLNKPVDSRTAAAMETSLRDLIRRLDAMEGLPPPSVLQPRIEAFRAASAAETRLADLDAAVRRVQSLAGGAGGAGGEGRDESAMRRDMESVSTVWADAIRDELKRYVPELAPAAFAADRSLKPALAELTAAMGEASGDDARLQKAAGVVTDALYRVQREVDSARTAMTRRDPIAAARANLAAAASTLRRRDPDPAAAARFTASAAEALTTAAEMSERARTARVLFELPDLSAFASPETSRAPLPRTGALPGSGAAGGAEAPPDLTGVPEQYKESVRAYFEKLPKAGGTP